MIIHREVFYFILNLFLFTLDRYIATSLSKTELNNNSYYIPHVNFPYLTSIDERLIFYNITHCYRYGKYCHVFAIGAGDILNYQGGHMMRKADARKVRSRQETFNSKAGHDT